ncbi:tetratricopeptide repeat protein [Pseudomonadota bacterium]
MVCVTAAVHEALPQRMPFTQASLGEQEIKGFAEPVRVYRVELNPGEPIPIPQEDSQPPTSTKIRSLIVTAAVTFLIVAGSVFYWFKYGLPHEEPASSERMAFPLPDKPSIAVLPFKNMSNDPEQEYFVDGITEDMITDLSQISGLFVIARNSVFTYKDKPTKVKQVAEELGVRYILEGSVRRAGDQIRINAQLIDATSGGHVWAKRYDGSIQYVFALQDKVSAQIVSALATNLTTLEFARIGLVQTKVPQAYDYFLHGMQHYLKATPDHYADAAKYFLHALELDPDFSQAHAVLASVFFKSFRQQFHSVLGLQAFEAWSKTEEHLQQAMEAPTSLALQVASGLSLTGRNHGEAIENAKSATTLEPNDANAHATLAFALIMDGHPEQALASVNLARRLDPHNEYYYVFLQGLSEFGQDNYQKAMTSFEHALELNPELWSSGDGYGCAPTPVAPLLSVYHNLGKKEAIRKLLQDRKFGCPINTTMLSWPYKESRDNDRLSNGLRGAGIPELHLL